MLHQHDNTTTATSSNSQAPQVPCARTYVRICQATTSHWCTWMHLKRIWQCLPSGGSSGMRHKSTWCCQQGSVCRALESVHDPTFIHDTTCRVGIRPAVVDRVVIAWSNIHTQNMCTHTHMHTHTDMHNKQLNQFMWMLRMYIIYNSLPQKCNL